MKRDEYRSSASIQDRSVRPNILRQRSGEGDPSTRENLLKTRSIPTFKDLHANSSSDFSDETIVNNRGK